MKLGMLTRRDFIHAGCLAGVATLVPKSAQSWPVHGSGTSLVNGGKSQVNLDFLQGGGEFPFINHLKTAPFWGHVSASTTAITPDLLDSDGYPLATPGNGGFNTVFFIPTQAEYATDWVLKWDGNGTVIFLGNGGGLTTVSGSATSSPWRVTPSSTTTVLTVGISVVGSPHIANMRCYPFAEEISFNAGAVFSAKFKSRLTQANFGVIRFFNWQAAGGISTNATTWDTANRPTTYFQYQSGQRRADFLCNSAGSGLTTNAGGSDYSVSACSAFPSLVDKATVQLVWNRSSPTSATVTNTGNNINWPAHGFAPNNQVYFTNGTSTGITISQLAYPFTNPYFIKTVIDADHFTVSLTPGGTVVTITSLSATGRCITTLNYAASSAVPILDLTVSPLTNDGNTFLTGGAEISFTTLVYDAQLNAWLNAGLNNSEGNLQNGVPYSLMIQLCKEVGAHPWFDAPRFACTPITDFFTQLATLCKNTGPSWMVPRFEGVNECWGSNPQSKYGSAIAASYGGSWDLNNWYGKSISLIGQSVNAVYGGTPATQTKYQVICGVQTSSFGDNNGAASSDPRLTAAQYVATQGGSAASNWVSHVCGANYFNPSIYGRNQELVLAFDYYVTNAGNAATQLIDASNYEAHDTDGMAISSFTNGSPLLVANTATPHGLFLGQIITIYTINGNAPIGPTNWWVNTIPTSTSFTFSSSDPNNGGATPINFSSSGTGTSWLIPNNGFDIPGVNVFFQNIATWAIGKNANIKVGCYEGGYSPDYSAAAVFGHITNGTATTNCVFTIPVITFQDIHSPAEQQNATNSGLVAGMRLNISGLSTLGSGWAIPDGTIITVTSVSGASITTGFNASGATGTLAAALATAGISFGFANIQSAGGVDSEVWLNALRFAGKSSTSLQANLTTMYNDLPAGSFPSMFQLGGNTTCFDGSRGGTYPSSNVWSVLEDIYQSPDPPQWLAAIAFNH